MPVSTPPPSAIKEFLGATTRHIRRVEIYESDGVTRWSKDRVARLKDGSVTVDYSREERRALDLTLSNSDGVLINAPGEFWYDKIIKVYRGVEVREPFRLPKVLIISDFTGQQSAAVKLKTVLLQLGFGDVRINTLASDYFSDIYPYDIIVSIGTRSDVTALLKRAYAEGKSVFVSGLYVGSFWTGSGATPTAGAILDSAVSARPVAHPVALGWSSFPIRLVTGFGTAVMTGARADYTSISNVTTSPSVQGSVIGAMTEPVKAGRAVAVNYCFGNEQMDEVGFVEFLKTAFTWLNTIQPVTTWEVQIGEFMIDRISESHFPHDIKITARDYTKKCILSKYVQATQFNAGQKLETLIATIAGAAGITKRLLPVTSITVGKTFFFERGVTRWQAMKDIANAYDHEIFFDATGYLILRPYLDPATSPPVFYIETGKDGIVASYEESTTDTRIYNHIIVTGESSDAAVPPVWATAKNELATSPTSISKIGDRVYEYSSSFIQTKAQAQGVADSFLAIHALEEFELTFSTLMLPWLECGEVLGWEDPNPTPGAPTRFMLSSLTLPLGLGPMSGVGKRVMNVG